MMKKINTFQFDKIIKIKDMNIYEQRWNNALKWATKVKTYFDTGDYILDWEERYNPLEHDFVIDDINKTISIDRKNGNSIQAIYEYDLEWDHGSYTTIAKTNTLLSEFKLYKMQQVIL